MAGGVQPHIMLALLVGVGGIVTLATGAEVLKGPIAAEFDDTTGTMREVGLYGQCGGAGGICNATDINNFPNGCPEEPWPEAFCIAGAKCCPVNEQYWQCKHMDMLTDQEKETCKAKKPRKEAKVIRWEQLNQPPSPQAVGPTQAQPLTFESPIPAGDLAPAPGPVIEPAFWNDMLGDVQDSDGAINWRDSLPPAQGPALEEDMYYDPNEDMAVLPEGFGEDEEKEAEQQQPNGALASAMTAWLFMGCATVLAAIMT